MLRPRNKREDARPARGFKQGLGLPRVARPARGFKQGLGLPRASGRKAGERLQAGFRPALRLGMQGRREATRSGYLEECVAGKSHLGVCRLALLQENKWDTLIPCQGSAFDISGSFEPMCKSIAGEC